MENEERTEKQSGGFRRWLGNRTKKQKIWLIVSAVTAVILIAAIVTLCVLFVEPRYDVDLNKVIRPENLVWSDEFEGDTLNTDVWSYGGSAKSLEEDPEGNYDVGGAYHKPQAVRVEDGKLNIHIYYNKEVGEWWCGGINSMAREGHDGYLKKFGYFEVKAKLADFGGCWSTFWLLGRDYDALNDRDATVAGAEIDIIESPLWPQNKIQQAIHVGGLKNHFSLPNPKYATKTYKKNLYKEYVTYGLYWNEEIYKFYVDGECAWTTHFNHNVSAAEQGIWLTIGTIGGPGETNHGLKGWANGNTLADRTHEDSGVYSVEYVRVYDVYDKNGNIIR